MPKKFSLLLVIFLLFLFSGFSCREAVITGEVPEYKIGETVPVDNLELIVDSCEKKEDIRQTIALEWEDKFPYQPERGSFLIVNFRFRGKKDNEAVTFDDKDLRVIDSKGVKYQDIEPFPVIDDWKKQTKTDPISYAMKNEEEEKNYMEIFDIPKDALGLFLEISTKVEGQRVLRAKVDLGI